MILPLKGTMFIYITCKKADLTANKTQRFSITKINWLI